MNTSTQFLKFQFTHSDFGNALSYELLGRLPENLAMHPTYHGGKRMEGRGIDTPELQQARLYGERTPDEYRPGSVMQIDYIDPDMQIPVRYFAPVDDSSEVITTYRQLELLSPEWQAAIARREG